MAFFSKKALKPILNMIKDRSKHLTSLFIKKKLTQNQLYAKQFVQHLQRRFQSHHHPIKLLDTQITALEEVLCKMFDELSKNTAVSQEELNKVFCQIKNNHLIAARMIFEKLRKISKENKEVTEEANFLKYLAIIYLVNGNKKLARVFYDESNRLAPSDAHREKLEIIFSNEDAFFSIQEHLKNAVYNPNICYPVPENGEIDLRRIRESVEELYKILKKYQLQNRNLELFVKFGLKGGLRKEPQENESVRLFYEILSKENGRIESLSTVSASTIKSRRYSLEEIKIFLTLTK